MHDFPTSYHCARSCSCPGYTANTHPDLFKAMIMKVLIYAFFILCSLMWRVSNIDATSVVPLVFYFLLRRCGAVPVMPRSNSCSGEVAEWRWRVRYLLHARLNSQFVNAVIIMIFSHFCLPVQAQYDVVLLLFAGPIFGRHGRDVRPQAAVDSARICGMGQPCNTRTSCADEQLLSIH